MSWDSCLIDGVPTLKCTEVVFQNVLTALGGLIFIVLLVMFIYGSVGWLTAGDDAQKLKKAQGTFYSAVLGLVIIAAAYLIIKILEGVLGLELSVFRIPE